MGSRGPPYKEQLLYVSMQPPFPYRAPKSSQKVEEVARYPLLYGSDICILRATATHQDLKSENNAN